MPPISRSCPICSSDFADFYFENNMATVGGFDMSYKIAHCLNCGFHYARNLPESSTYSAYYQSVSKYDVQSKLSAVDQQRIDLTVHFLEGRVDKHAKIVDLGCGNGGLLAGLQKNGWQNLQGLDPAPNSAQLARTIYGVLDIARGTLSEAHDVLNLQEVDVVCIMSVLEHLPNLRQDLEQLFANLPIGCKILLEVPAIEFFPSLNFEPFGEFSLEHIQFFDLQSISNLMSSLGAKTVAIELIDLPIVASGAILGLFEWNGRETGNLDFSFTQSNLMHRYIEQSHQYLNLALNKIPNGPLIVFGAGSHTARLLSHLENSTRSEVISIIDSNTNLIGKKMGRWTVSSIDTICKTPEIPVLVSSFRSQNSIAARLKEFVTNPIILMYE